MSNQISLIKEPYKKTVFKTQKELEDFTKCCDPEYGYLYFMDNFFMIQHPTRGAMNYHPWEYQKRLIETYHKYRYSISLMPRQTGKCFGINTIVHIRNKLTGLVENITIGEFYDRQSNMFDMQERTKGIAFPFISQTPNDCHPIPNFVPELPDQSQVFTRTKFKKFLRRTQSGIQSWWNIISLFKEIQKRKYYSGNCKKSGAYKKGKWNTYYQNRILVEKNQWEFRRGASVAETTTDYIFAREMHSTTWRRAWNGDLEIPTAKMAEVFEKEQLFQNFTKAIHSNYGNLPGTKGVLCHERESGYDKLYEQGISATLDKRTYGNAGFHRLGQQKNNRVRRDLLARSSFGKSSKRSVKRPDDLCGWVSDITYTRRGLSCFAGNGDSRILKLSDTVERKFIDTEGASEYEILTDTGWQPLLYIHKTIPYTVWSIKTENGLHLECADTHILFDKNMEEVFTKDLVLGNMIQTKDGLSKIVKINKSETSENMFDVSIDDDNHRFYTNGILSHNSTSAAGYLLWYAMFVPDSTILIAAHKYAGAQEIMQRIRYAYENCPYHIKAGIVTYNKGSLEFDNGSRIVSATTTENTGRGMSISLLYLDEFAFVRPSIATEFWTSITPTLSTGGKAIITSTPNSDEDQFALIWKGANKTEDEYGNTTELGVNGFRAFRSYWHEHPERDEKWAAEMKAQLGDDRFKREMDCFNGSTSIKVRDKFGNIYNTTMRNLEKMLSGEINNFSEN